MASVVIAGDTSGTVTISAPAVAGSTTLTLPTTNGTLSTGMVNLGTITLSGTGNQFSLTGLTLTSYKQLYITVNNIPIAASSSFSTANTTGNQISNNGFSTPAAANYYTGTLTLDLNTGYVYASYADKTNANTFIRNASVLTLPIPLGTSLNYTNYNGGPTAIGTASTAVYFWINDAATKSGTITIYGVA